MIKEGKQEQRLFDVIDACPSLLTMIKNMVQLMQYILTLLQFLNYRVKNNSGW